MPNEAVVHVVDDDLAVRQALSFLLASDVVPVRLHESASAFLERVGELSAGCIVTDVRMPGIDGIEFLRRLKAQGITLPVIVMTGHADVPLAVEAMKLGAVEFIEKPFDDDLFLAAIHSALAHGQEHASREAQAKEAHARVQSLSEGISPRTVEIYRANVMARMHAKSLSELVRMAMLFARVNRGSRLAT